MVKLTPRQQEILDFIRSNVEMLGAPPTRAEIATAFGFSSHNAAEEHLKALAKKGVVVLEPGSARGIRLVEQLGLPLIGSVAAGSPILAVENVQGRYALDASLFKPRADFLLRVRGLSMIDAGIDDGDLVVIRKKQRANDGDIVVALVDNQNTLKRFYRDEENKRIILHPENKKFCDIYTEECTIQGVACHIIKEI